MIGLLIFTRLDVSLNWN